MQELYERLSILREQLTIECHKAWDALLDDFTSKYHSMQQGVKQLAILDAIQALASVAAKYGYVR